MSSEEVRKRIEKEVKRRLEEHFDQLKEEFERMRIESHRKWEEFVMRLDFPLPELVPSELIPEPAPPAPPPTPSGAADLRELPMSSDAAATHACACQTT